MHLPEMLSSLNRLRSMRLVRVNPPSGREKIKRAQKFQAFTTGRQT
jgi:hypothetical protein